MRVNELEEMDKRLVLLSSMFDPNFVVDCLSLDLNQGTELSAAAAELVELAPEMRVSLIGSLLRDSRVGR